MLCCVMLCYAMLCYAMPCFAPRRASSRPCRRRAACAGAPPGPSSWRTCHKCIYAMLCYAMYLSRHAAHAYDAAALSFDRMLCGSVQVERDPREEHQRAAVHQRALDLQRHQGREADLARPRVCAHRGSNAPCPALHEDVPRLIGARRSRPEARLARRTAVHARLHLARRPAPRPAMRGCILPPCCGVLHGASFG